MATPAQNAFVLDGQPAAGAQPVNYASARSSKSTRARWPGVGLALPVLVAVAWELAVQSGWGNGRLVAPPSRILTTLWALASDGSLWVHLRATISRVAAGFVCGVVTATVVGAIAGYSTLARRVLDPTLQGLRAVPSIAWVPLFILWFGIFEQSKIILIAVGVFFPVYLGVLGAISAIDRKIIEVGRVARLNGFAMTRRILLPAILPSYILSLRTGLGLGWMFVVAAEFMGASEGLGYLLVDGQQLGKPDQIVAAIIAFAIVGKITDGILSASTAPLVRWHDTYQRAD